ncbi:MAG: MraY family glycosyltransferase [bacterium]|nr:MraY family glycosyltransferase [bacterium]
MPYLQNLLTGFFLTILITPFVILLMKRFRILDDPTSHKHPGIIHKKPTPRGGGLALFLGSFFATLFTLPFSPILAGIFLASFIAMITGLFDDYKNAKGEDLSPYIRFFVNIICAAIVVAIGVKIHFVTNPFGGILLLSTPLLTLDFLTITISDVVSVLWIVWVMNMLNWSKGVDGQMPGIVGISAIVIGILSIRTASSQFGFLDANLSFIIAGVSFGFLLYNFFPAKIFPGYGGTAIYLLLAVVSVLSSAKLATAVLVMGIPTVDAVFTIMRRILSGKSPFWHDNKHLHHLLLRLGMSQRTIALSYWLFSAILGTISLALESKSKLFALIMLGVIAGGALLFLHFILRKSDETVTT